MTALALSVFRGIVGNGLEMEKVYVYLPQVNAAFSNIFASILLRSPILRQRLFKLTLGGYVQNNTSNFQKNVLGEPLKLCCSQPMTGFFRDGFCRTNNDDVGRHIVCAQVDRRFLEFSKEQGNDLSTPGPSFPGLQAGDYWCLCASRWLQAWQAGFAPPVLLEACEASALKIIDLEILQAHALAVQSQ